MPNLSKREKMNKSIRILILGLVTILGLSGFTSCESEDVEVNKNAVDQVVYSKHNHNSFYYTFEIHEGPKNGEARVINGFKGNNSTKLLYTPNANYTGKDTIKINSKENLTEYTGPFGGKPAKGITINITVVESNLVRNTKPMADDQNITVDYETPIDFKLTGSDKDNDTFTFVVENNTANGTIVLIDETTGDVTYTPNQGYSGADHFTFKVVDEFNASSNVADVNITVKSLCDMDPTAPGCPGDPCLANPTMTPGCPGFDPCLLDPTATGCPLDPCLLDPTATGCPLDPCIIDPFSIECQNSIQV